MRKILTIILSIMLITNLCWAGVDFELGDGDGVLYRADGGSTDINGANTDITLTAWIKLESLVAAGDDAAVVGKFSWNGALLQYTMFLNADEKLMGDLSSDGTAETTITGTTALSTGTWYHCAIVYDDSLASGNLQLYLNGASDATAINYTAGIANTASLFGIGSWDGATTGSATWSSEFDGEITEVAIWDIALTTTEISLLYNSRIKGMPLQIQSANLKGYWPMDDVPTGTVLNTSNPTFNDLSGNGANVTGDADGNSSQTIGETILNYPSPILTGM